MKKSAKTFFILSLVFAVLAVALFILAPVILQWAGSEFVYYFDKSALSVFTNFASVFSFSNIYSIIAVILLGVFGLLWLLWLVMIIVKRHTRAIAPLIFTLLVFALTYVVASVYLFDSGYSAALSESFDSSIGYAASTEVNLHGNLLGFMGAFWTYQGFPAIIMYLSVAALACGGLAALFGILCAILDMASPKVVSKQLEEGGSKDDLSNVDQFASAEELEELLNQSEPQPEPVAAQPAPAQNPQPVIVQQYFGKDSPLPGNGASSDEIRSIVREELEKDDLRAIMHTELPSGHKEEIKEAVREELANANLLSAEEVRQIVREELAKFALVAPLEEEARPEPVSEPQPVEEEPVSEPEPVEEPAPEVEPAPLPEVPEAEPKKIIRIPFTDRIENMSPEQRDHFNELKSEIMAYGVKSRISNSGDTFRLHTKTYVKMVIAGKGLKLYLAVDPAKYENSTIPFNNVGHKNIYKDIPFAFKVKSDLSMRRAKDLIAEAMASGNLEKGEVAQKDWIQEIIDNKANVESDPNDAVEEE